MRLLYTLTAVFAVCSFGHAQVVIGQESAPQVGDSWASFNFIVPSMTFPVPEVGTSMVYDFTALGDFVEEDFGVAIKDIPLENIFRTDILDVPVGTGEPAFENLPATALLTNTVFPGFDDEGNAIVFSSVIDVTEQAVFILAETDFGIVNDEFVLVITSLPTPELVFTFGQSLGDETTTEVSEVTDNVDFGTQDSTYLTETMTYVGFGSLRTWFGNYDEVAVYKTISQFRLFTRALGSTDDYSIGSVQITVDYNFVRPGSFAPVVAYSYDTFDPETLPVPENITFSFSQPIKLTDVTTVSTEALRFSAAPNPATEEVSVRFEQAAAGPASLRLYDMAGREVLQRDLGVLPAGNQQVRVALPDHLRAGAFVLRITSGGQTAALPLVIR
jgi:methionine-rich copper-binding protein CopC